MKKGCQLLRKCQEIADRIGLFSTNEEKEDISTGDLKYLLVRSQLPWTSSTAPCSFETVLSFSTCMCSS